jgi:inosine triphosphate pyrophosphatase
MVPTKLIFVTGNANKLREVSEILDDTVALESRAIDLPELQGTIEEISKDKCRRAAEVVGWDEGDEKAKC